MRHSLLRNTFFVLGTLAAVVSLAAYVRSETAPSRLGPQGVVTVRTRAIVRGDTAYVVGPPEVVADLAEINTQAIAPDNNAVLLAGVRARPYRDAPADPGAARSDMQRLPELDLIYWDTRTRVSQTLLREKLTDNGETDIENVAWFPGTRAALVVIGNDTTDVHRLYRVSPGTGTVTRLWERADFGQFAMAPRDPIAFVYTKPIPGGNGQPDTPPTLRFYTPQEARPSITLSEPLGYLHWTMDAKYVYCRNASKAAVDGKDTTRAKYTAIDVQTRQVSQLDAVPDSGPVEPPPAPTKGWGLRLATASDTVTSSGGQAQRLPTLELLSSISAAPLPAQATDTSSPQTGIPAQTRATLLRIMASESLTVASGVDEGKILDGINTSAVLFKREGIVYAAPIFRMPIDTLASALNKAQRAATSSNAKQVALGILQYIQDYDEIMPRADSPVVNNLMPYVRNGSVFDNPALGQPGFVYTYNGPSAYGDIEAVANTQMGYVSGIGGKAILWADGHVTWQDDK